MEWISVKDRLPKNQDPVIVYTDDSTDMYGDETGRYVGMAYYTWTPKGGYWAGTDGNVYGAIGIINVTHWMPLPSPPTEMRGVE